MSLKKNKVIIRKMVEAMNERDLDLLDEFIAHDYVDHTHNLRGPEELKKFLTVLYKGLDLHFSIEDMIAEGEKVWVRMSFIGMHVGDFMGFVPTYKKATETAIQMYRIVNGKIVENWQVSNPLDLLIQLGAVEYTEKGKKLQQV
jgi:C-1 hydroxylase